MYNINKIEVPLEKIRRRKLYLGLPSSDGSSLFPEYACISAFSKLHKMIRTLCYAVKLEDIMTAYTCFQAGI